MPIEDYEERRRIIVNYPDLPVDLLAKVLDEGWSTEDAEREYAARKIIKGYTPFLFDREELRQCLVRCQCSRLH